MAVRVVGPSRRTLLEVTLRRVDVASADLDVPEVVVLHDDHPLVAEPAIQIEALREERRGGEAVNESEESTRGGGEGAPRRGVRLRVPP